VRSRALDDAIRAIPIAWFRPDPAVYWPDLLVSAGIGWASLALTSIVPGWPRLPLLALAIIALYRAVLFIHEITHRAGRDLPAFTAVWNLLVGIPLLVPSFLYEGVHTDHHRQSCYGTTADPEYIPFGRRPPSMMAGAALASLLAPFALSIRFGILAPLSWFVPAIRRFVLRYASALVINHRYARRAPIGRAGLLQEAGACLVCWTAFVLWWNGRLPGSAVVAYVAVSSIVSAVNAVRTLAAHRYDHDAGELTMTDQLLDSCTIAPGHRLIRQLTDGCRALVAPVGLRYHALHHWIPSLPYHNLGRAHRVLVSTLGADAPYRATVEPGFLPPLRDLLHRARTRSQVR
jgi:fatty acid desaturase